MEKGAGYYYEIRMRLRGQLAHHHWNLGKPFTQNQEDAWDLLNGFDSVIDVLARVVRHVPMNEKLELTSQVRHALLMHQPAWKASPRIAGNAKDQGSQSAQEPHEQELASTQRQD